MWNVDLLFQIVNPGGYSRLFWIELFFQSIFTVSVYIYSSSLTHLLFQNADLLFTFTVQTVNLQFQNGETTLIV